MATWSVELLLLLLLLLVVVVASQEARGGRLVVRSLKPSWQHWRQQQQEQHSDVLDDRGCHASCDLSRLPVMRPCPCGEWAHP